MGWGFRPAQPGFRFREGTAESLPYPDAAFDLVFMGLLFHEADDRLKPMQEPLRVIRQRVAILEGPYETQDFGPGLEERLTEKEMQELALHAGLAAPQTTHLHSLVLYLLGK